MEPDVDKDIGWSHANIGWEFKGIWGVRQVSEARIKRNLRAEKDSRRVVSAATMNKELWRCIRALMLTVREVERDHEASS